MERSVAVMGPRDRGTGRKKRSTSEAKRAVLLGSLILAACSGGAPAVSGSPCEMLCMKQNSCSSGSTVGSIPCGTVCTYGGNYYPGLAPSPVCPVLEAQTKCAAEAVALGCGEYQNAAARCPVCPPLVGSPCSSDADCLKCVAAYRCDVSRSGGYCTAPCSSADDCSVGGPEVCGEGAAPSFALGATSTQTWCLLGCKSDVQCRSNEGYRCQNISPGDQGGTCDSP